MTKLARRKRVEQLWFCWCVKNTVRLFTLRLYSSVCLDNAFSRFQLISDAVEWNLDEFYARSGAVKDVDLKSL